MEVEAPAPPRVMPVKTIAPMTIGAEDPHAALLRQVSGGSTSSTEWAGLASARSHSTLVSVGSAGSFVSAGSSAGAAEWGTEDDSELVDAARSSLLAAAESAANKPPRPLALGPLRPPSLEVGDSTSRAAAHPAPSPAPAVMSMAGVYVVDFSFDELELRLLDVRTSARRMVRKLRARARERAVRSPAAAGTNDTVGSREEEDDDGPPGAGDDSMGGAMTARSVLADDEDAGAQSDEPSSRDLVFTMRSLRSGIEYSTDAIGLTASLRSVDVDDYYQRAGPAFRRLIGTAASEATGPARSVATGGSPAADAAAGSSRDASSDSLTELIRVRVQQKARPDRAAGEVPLAASLRFSSLHIGYNPETVAALQLYGLYLVECAFGGATAASPPALTWAIIERTASMGPSPAGSGRGRSATRLSPVRPRRSRRFNTN
jgi:hypothetical protein